MKIVGIQDLHADGGWRTLSFLKIVTDEGLVGWSEYHEGNAVPGLTAAIKRLAAGVVGEDPRNVSRLSAALRATVRSQAGGTGTHALAAIENACLDIKAKALGVPVYELFGGALSTRLEAYWSQCGTLRTQHAALFGVPALATLDDVQRLGREAAERGFRSLKTNIICFDGDGGKNYRPGFGHGPAHPALNLDARTVASIVALLEAFQDGAGPDVRLMLDLNYNVKPEGVRQLARALEPLQLMWLELDMRDPRALRELRSAVRVPIASLETILGRQAFRPYLDESAVDVAIVDPQWNGMLEAVKMANLAESYEVNIASHNYHGPLSTLMGIHFSAAIPNNRIVEYVVDEAPWVSTFVTHPPILEQGMLRLPTRPGWGADVDENIVAQFPPKAA